MTNSKIKQLEKDHEALSNRIKGLMAERNIVTRELKAERAKLASHDGDSFPGWHAAITHELANADGPLSVRDISAAVMERYKIVSTDPYNTAMQTLIREMNNGKVDRVGRGLYALVSDEG